MKVQLAVFDATAVTECGKTMQTKETLKAF
jgi:hypothetical protein